MGNKEASRYDVHAGSATESIITMDGVNGCVIVSDTCNGGLSTLENALNVLLKQPNKKRFTAILSDTIRTSEQTEVYSEIANLLKQRGVSKFIGIGSELQQNQKAFEGISAKFYSDTEAFIKSFSAIDFDCENILLKGENSFSFEKIRELLGDKTHETVLEIDLSKLRDNFRYIKSKLKPETKVMVMVKAFAYGSDSREVAQHLVYLGAEYLSVAYADEGVALRQNDIDAPILVLNPEIPAYPEMIKYHLEPQIFSFRTLEYFIKALEKTKGFHEPYPVHIKLNSGMNRLGFEPNDMEQLGKLLSESPSIKVVSAFSHLSGSDEPKMDDYTDIQFQKFSSAADALGNQLSYPFERHILNSTGVFRHPDYQLDMVRLGIALYGSSSHGEARKNLQPISKLTAKISQIRNVEANQVVGYSPTPKLHSPRKIAVLAIGYADGYPRLLGNGIGRVYINGKYAVTVGNICMDMCMVDVSDIDCAEGDTAEIFGENVDIYELAEKLNTIPYEVLTNISQRVKRISKQY